VTLWFLLPDTAGEGKRKKRKKKRRGGKREISYWPIIRPAASDTTRPVVVIATATQCRGSGTRDVPDGRRKEKKGED